MAWAPPGAGLRVASADLLGCAPVYLPLLALLLALAALLEISLPVGRTRWPVHGADAAGAAGLLLCPGPGLWVASVAAAGMIAVAGRVTGRRRWRSLEFGICGALLQVGAALATVAGLRQAGLGPLPAAFVAVVLAGVVRHVMAAVGVELTSRRPLRGLLLPRLPGAVVTAAGNGAVGLLGGWLVLNAPWGIAGLAVPGLLLASTYELHSRHSAEARLFAALATEQQYAAGRSLEQSVAVLMTVTARMLGGADVELLLSGPEGLIRYAGDESGVGQRTRTDPSAFDAPWVRQVLAGGGVRIAIDEGRPSCAFAAGNGGNGGTGRNGGNGKSPRAVVIARRPLGGSGFSRRDAVYAQALARQSAAWLAPAPDALAARDPRLEVVREIARRLLRSPEPSGAPGWSSALLDDVHSLERAVAALLGSAPGGRIPPQRNRRAALSAASAGSPAGDEAVEPSDEVATDRAEDAQPEWTTTGLLR